MSVLLRYLTNPSTNYISTIKHALQYLQGTPNLGITYRGGALEELYRYSDLDYTSYIETRRLTIRYLFNYYSSVISFRSKRLQVVALFSIETEYYRLSNTIREAAWLRQLFYKLSVNSKDTKTIRIYSNN
jgi:hypothetical protein